MIIGVVAFKKAKHFVLGWICYGKLRNIYSFVQVFELLDRDGGGSLDAQELYTVMKELDIEVSLDEIESVLQELDKDGNGEIDFDEFLYTMSETDRYLEMLSSGEFSITGQV